MMRLYYILTSAVVLLGVCAQAGSQAKIPESDPTAKAAPTQTDPLKDPKCQQRFEQFFGPEAVKVDRTDIDTLRDMCDMRELVYHHNHKEAALLILKSRLFELEQEKLNAEIEELKGEKQEIAFGSQIRSYVLYPYQMVKDHRTDVETGNVDAVLTGDIERFVVGYHRWRVGEETAAGVVERDG